MITCNVELRLNFKMIKNESPLFDLPFVDFTLMVYSVSTDLTLALCFEEETWVTRKREVIAPCPFLFSQVKRGQLSL